MFIQRNFYPFVLGSVLWMGCSQNHELSDPRTQEIRLTNHVLNSTKTSVSTLHKTGYQLGVFSYKTTPYAFDAPEIINGVAYELEEELQQGKSVWGFEELYFWDDHAISYDFFAYAPVLKDTTYTRVGLIRDEELGDQLFYKGFEVAHSQEDQLDFLVSKAYSGFPYVFPQLVFQHTLAQVNFRIAIDSVAMPNWDVRIDHLALRLSSPKKADLRYHYKEGQALWSAVARDTFSYELAAPLHLLSSVTSSGLSVAKPAELQDFLFIPDKGVDIEFDLRFSLGGEAPRDRQVTLSDAHFKAGRSHTFTLIIGQNLQEITFGTTTGDWEEE